jgi:hypothetical protein
LCIINRIAEENLTPDDPNSHAPSFPAVRIPRPHPTIAESIQHRRRIDAYPLTNPCQRPADLVQPYCFIDLLWRRPASAHRHAAALQGLTYRPSVDPEPVAQLVHRRPTLVPCDEPPYLLVVELPRPARLSSIS